MKEIKELDIRIDDAQDNEQLTTAIMDLWSKVDELVREVNRLNRLQLPTVNLDEPEKNCSVCEHEHPGRWCKCGCIRIP